MTLAHEQPATGAQQGGDHLGPAPDVRQPADRADAGVDQIATSHPECGDRLVHIAFDEPDRGAGAQSQGDAGGDRRGREVQPRHRPRAEPGQRHGIGADVALQVHHIEVGDRVQPR